MRVLQQKNALLRHSANGQERPYAEKRTLLEVLNTELAAQGEALQQRRREYLTLLAPRACANYEAAAAAQITGEHPVLLLDDVLSELDEGRKQYLLTCMKEKQTFVTSCDDTDFLKTDGEVYRMDGGVLSRV